MAIRSRTVRYGVFGKCLKITNGEASVYVTLELGPRIIRYSRSGGKNMFFEDREAVLQNSGEDFDRYYYPGAYWRNYGGHRIWFSPESMPGSYYPDNDPVFFKKQGDTFVFTPKEQKENGVAYQLEVTMDEQGTGVTVKNRIRNITGNMKTFAVWSITVMCKNGLEVFRQNTEDTVLLHNRNLSLWPYADMTDRRVYFGKRFISLRQDPKADRPFKIGTDNHSGASVYFAGGDMFIKRFDFRRDSIYPDNGCSFETYTNPHILEIESLSPLYDAASEEAIEHTERWSIAADTARPSPKDEEAFERIFAKHSL